VETLRAALGPVVEVHEVTPETPLIAHVPIALGAVAPVGPVTVAVKVIVEPSCALVDPATTETVGVDFPTVVVAPEVGAVAK
jgi:hypothetical protein